MNYLKVLTLNDGSQYEVTTETWAAFGKAYTRTDEEVDHHKLFADLLDVDRDTAKEIAFRMQYTNVLFNNLMKELRSTIPKFSESDRKAAFYTLEQSLERRLKEPRGNRNNDE